MKITYCAMNAVESPEAIVNVASDVCQCQRVCYLQMVESLDVKPNHCYDG